MLAVWLMWQVPRLHPTMVALFEVHPGVRPLAAQAPALLLAWVSHARLRHLAVNLASLALVGGPLEATQGPGALLLWFLGGGAALLASLHALRVVGAAVSGAARRLAPWRGGGPGGGAAAGSAGRGRRAPALRGAVAGVKGAEPGLYVLLGVALVHQTAASARAVATGGLSQAEVAPQLLAWLPEVGARCADCCWPFSHVC